MKTSFSFLAILLLLSLTVLSQDMKDISEVEFKSAEDYTLHEEKVLNSANYVLSVPMDDSQRLLALQTITRWMSGTPDYHFEIDGNIADLMKKNDDVFGLYMAAMTKYVLENKEQAKDKAAVKLHTYETLLSYCENPANKVTMTKDLKKAIAAKRKGKLKEYLGV